MENLHASIFIIIIQYSYDVKTPAKINYLNWVGIMNIK